LLKPEQLERIEVLRAEGASLHQISREVGCAVATVARVLNRGRPQDSSKRRAGGTQPQIPAEPLKIQTVTVDPAEAQSKARGLEELWRLLMDRSGSVPANAKAQIVREIARLEGWEMAVEQSIPAPLTLDERRTRLFRILDAMPIKEVEGHLVAYMDGPVGLSEAPGEDKKAQTSPKTSGP